MMILWILIFILILIIGLIIMNKKSVFVGEGERYRLAVVSSPSHKINKIKLPGHILYLKDYYKTKLSILHRAKQAHVKPLRLHVL